MKNSNLENYINKSKNSETFKFIKDIKLQEVLYLFSSYIFLIYLSEIKDNKYCEKSKEMKAHTILIYLGSIIEAVIYYFVNEKLKDKKSKNKYLELEKLIKVQKIKETENLYICKLEKKEITLNETINFNSLINWIKDKKIIDTKIIDKINYFRKMRNMIHIKVFIDYNEYQLIETLEKAFIDTKEIFDYIKIQLWK